MKQVLPGDRGLLPVGVGRKSTLRQDIVLLKIQGYFIMFFLAGKTKKQAIIIFFCGTGA
jgi:hypothetical protein